MYSISDSNDVKLSVSFNGKKTVELDYLNDVNICKEYYSKHSNKFNKINENSLFNLKDSEFKNKLSDDLENSNTEIKCKFDIEDKTYKTTIGNIPIKYMIRNGEVVVPEIVKEYCVNIVRRLYEEGYRFDDNKVICFQEYLV